MRKLGTASHILAFAAACALASPPQALAGGASIHGVAAERRALTFELCVAGCELDRVVSVTLVGHHGRWREPLRISSATRESLRARQEFAARVPPCEAELRFRDGRILRASLVGDAEPPPPRPAPWPGACESRALERWAKADTGLVQPKDFALLPEGWTADGAWAAHLFYIRSNRYLAEGDREKNFGHAATDVWGRWRVLDTAAVSVRSGRFDSRHVWAPSIVRSGLSYFMYYAGVDSAGTQRIGIARSRDLVHWEQRDSVLEIDQGGSGAIPWADPSPRMTGGVTQLRDPCVIADPARPGSWLMYFVTIPRQAADRTMAIGVARNNGDMRTWRDAGKLNGLLAPHQGARLESPAVFRAADRWCLIFMVDGDSSWVSFGSGTLTPAATFWSQAVPLATLLPAGQREQIRSWHALEHASTTEGDWLGAFDDANVAIAMAPWTLMLGGGFRFGCFTPAASEPRTPN